MIALITAPLASEREDLAHYRALGGYRGLQQAYERGPAWVLAQVSAAGLRGRGGSGQGRPTAARWERVAAAPHPTRYVIANGAESCPVSQKDRFLMARFPHRVLEGLLAAALATGAGTAYLYIRGDADAAVASMAEAVREAEAAGLCGPVQVRVQTAIPSYIAGEETAVIDALEGLEGLPQPRPPHPEEAGLRGCPTVVNNVETLAAAAAILRQGPAAFRAAGTPDCPGTALFTVSGDVAAPGVYEVPYGTPLAALLQMAGAPPADRLLAVLPGGPGSGPLRPDELDVPLTYEGLAACGSSLGAAAPVVLARERGTTLPAAVAATAAFLAEASCGQCRGCKEGCAALAGALAAGEAERARHLASLLLYGRGNCAHPTATARMALRALTAFPQQFCGP